ncbi:MAG: DUF4270 family protein [Bacteroidota bacterium]
MNLWVKHVGQLAVLAVALFFLSCEDEASLLGFNNNNRKFNVSYIEIPVKSSVLRIDSVITDNFPFGNNASSNTVLVGKYQDNTFGDVRAEAYLQLVPILTTALETSAVFDSVTFELRSNFYSYGLTGKRQESFKVHEITGTKLDPSKAVRYYYNSNVAYDPTELGEAKVTVHYDSLKKNAALQSSQQDTIIARARLTQAFGQRLFTTSQSVLDSLKLIAFTNDFKGFALIPSQSEAVLGFKPIEGLSRVVLHYHTMENSAVKDTLVRYFTFNYPSYTNITTDRSATELAALTAPYQSQEFASGKRYLQSGSPVVTKFDFSKFYEFADTIDHMIITSAEFVISGVDAPTAYPPPSRLSLKVLHNDNELFYNAYDSAQRSVMSKYHVILDGFWHYIVNSDFSTQAAAIDYNGDDDVYRGHISFFLQNLYERKSEEDRIKFLAAYPSSISTTVNRAVFTENNVKLRVYYTRPVTVKP